MKIRFEPNLDFQTEAVNAVCELFRGQDLCRTEFTVVRDATDPQQAFAFHTSDLGIGNRLTLLPEQILANMQRIQLQNGLRPSASIESGDFTVEMETGTGKTYVYLKTVFELNRRFGFTKFVVVVPSVAIKEGVYKTLQMTEEHFRSLYAGVPYDYFPYDSSKLGQVRNFATSAEIQIMVVTVGAINKKDVNNLYKNREQTGGERPIDLIKATCPIVIVDEPQSVDGDRGGLEGRGREALAAMKPLCTLRYSATHLNEHHMVYRLDALDAYQRHLVKQIEVAAGTVEAAHNKPFVRLLAVKNTRGTISARVEIDKEESGRVRRQEVTVQDGDDLEQTTRRGIYADHRVGEIRTGRGHESVELRVPGGERHLRPGEAFGDVDQSSVQREMIRRTIREHLEKEKRLRPQGIKVLSLFFIDAVEKYRQYDTDGHWVKGEYAKIFEEEYARLVRHPDFQSLFEGVDLSQAATEAHNGYFSIDRRGGWTDTEEGNQTSRDNAERAYSLIMREKEELLSLKNPLKFIFSHSALREGWDNPNVFQICALRDISTTRERRQTIGRGLRLCVNQEGDRVHGFDVNTLTVVATESYEDFADNLQKEIEADTGIRFGVLEDHQFAAIAVDGPSGEKQPLGFEQSKALWEVLRSQGYVDKSGKVQDALKAALANSTLTVPDEFKPHFPEIAEILRKVAGRLEIKNADERRRVRLRAAALHSASFKALWDRVKAKTTYSVTFDNEKLIADCAHALRDAPAIPRSRLQWRKAGLTIGKGGVDAFEKPGSAQPAPLDEQDVELPDLLTALQDRTQLTRRSVFRILTESLRLDDFRRNPQEFVEIAAATINRQKQLALVDGIVYRRVGDSEVYSQERFDTEELTGYVRNMLRGTKSIYEDVVCQSGSEREFAQRMEDEMAVKLYVKLPAWFQIPTPLGFYNPDWALAIQDGEGEQLYFVVETKGVGALLPGALRGTEEGKIECGKAHFKALADGGSGIRFKVADTLQRLLDGID